jgi:AraC-like DNA-binding protein
MTENPDDKTRALLARPGIGLTARVVQRSDLRFSRIAVDHPALILLRHGRKTLQSAAGSWSIKGGEAIAVAGGQDFDVTNRLSDRGLYEARWLVFDPAILDRARLGTADGRPLAGAARLSRIAPQFSAAFDRAVEAIWEVRDIPNEVAEHRVAEILVWLAQQGVHFPPLAMPSLTTRVRRLVGAAPAEAWTTSMAAGHLAMSEPTLRRHLAAEGATFGALLTDVRMSTALLLLQSTDAAVNRIALDVGYDSASRFAIRFRQRFGLAPTAIRGHERG